MSSLTNRREFIGGMVAASAPLIGRAYPIKSMLGTRQAHLNCENSAPWHFYFESLSDGSSVSMSKTGSPPSISLEYSIDDGKTWMPFDADSGATSIVVDAGQRAYFKASNINARLASNESNYHFFGGTGSFNVGGNIMSLLDGTHNRSSFGSDFTGQYIYAGLFRNSTMIGDASELILPLDTKIGCFARMFQNSSVKVSPEIPATELSTNCYLQMFSDARMLTTAPTVLPATTSMSQCYYAMFLRCYELESSPHIALQTYSSNCMSSMFESCRKISSISVDFTSFGGTSNWVRGISATGTFYCPETLGTNDTIARGTSACPTGWTVVNTD